MNDFDDILLAITNNDPSFTKLYLTVDTEWIHKINEDKQLQFLEALATNHTITLLSSDRLEFISNFAKGLVEALECNFSITSFYYNPASFTSEDLAVIERVLQRNRAIVLETEVKAEIIEMEYPEPERVFYMAVDAVKYARLNELYTLVAAFPNLLDEFDDLYQTLLKLAVTYNQTNCIKLLIQLGAAVDFSPPDHIGRRITPLYLAIVEQQYSNIELLLLAGAKVKLDEAEIPYLHLVKRVSIAQLLIKYGARDCIIKKYFFPHLYAGDTILHSITRNIETTFYEPGLLSYFIQLNAPVSKQRFDGDTPLHLL